MKNYKEINDKIVVRDEWKEKTYEKMMKQKHRHTKRYVLAATSCLMFMIVILLNTASPSVAPKIQRKQEKFNLSTYLVDDELYFYNNKTVLSKVNYDIAGSVVQLDLKKYGLEKFKDTSKFVIPPDFTRNELYYEWRGDAQERYPFILFDYETETQNVYVEIRDKRMPTCTPIDDIIPYKKYKSYELYIYRNQIQKDQLFYHAFAKKGDYVYEINANVEDEAIFVDFLVSLLQ